MTRIGKAVVCAFLLTLCVLLLIGGLLLVSLRSGRTLFGDGYESVLAQREWSRVESDTTAFVCLPARLRVVWQIPKWEAQCCEWLLFRDTKRGEVTM